MGEEKGKGKLVIKKEPEDEEEIKKLFLRIMEGYNDPAAKVPPLSYFSPSVTEKCTETSRARNTLKERKRKDRMNDNFNLLQSMVPTLSDKVKNSKDTIVSEAIWYVKCLKEEVQRLEGLKKSEYQEPKLRKFDLSKGTNQKSSNKVAVFKGTTFFATQLPFKRGLVPEIAKVLGKYKAEVLEARVCVNEQRILTFTATLNLGSDGGNNTIEKIKEEILVL